MTRILSAVALSMLVTCPALATSFWLSPFGTELGSTQPTSLGEIPTLYNFDTQSTGSVYVWAQTDLNQTLKNWSLRVESTNPNTLQFTTSTVYNPELFEDSNGFKHVRWEYTIQPAGQVTDANCNMVCSHDFMGFTITNDPNDNPDNHIADGIGPNTPTVDPDYYGLNDGSGSWLLAKLDYSIGLSSTTTDLFLQIGTLGLNNVGQSSSETDVLFGHTADGLLDPINRHISSSVRDARVQVLPKPDADFDNDTFVTGADFLIWQRNSGTTGMDPNEGDATGEGNVDGIDLAAWEFQYGMTIPLVGLMVDSMAVPEPATWGLACLAYSVLLTRSRRRLPIGDP